MPLRQSVQRLAGNEFLCDLALEGGAVFAFKGEGAIIRLRQRMVQVFGAHGRRQDPKTPVEQALMRGLGTA